MTLIKSISGTRGTIGGKPGENLTPMDIVESTAAYAEWIKSNSWPEIIVVGRDARISGAMVSNIAINTLLGMGMDVIDLGLSTTPTVEMAVINKNAGGGIVFTASHNPKEWNALKFLDKNGEFISRDAGKKILALAEEKNIQFAEVDQLGIMRSYETSIKDHINSILNLEIIDVDKIKQQNYNVVVDAINSTGGLAIAPLLDALNVKYSVINDDLSGNFAHNPEPLPKHLGVLSEKVKEYKADMGIAVDPDVDRLVFVCEDGQFFGEEYTLVAAADFVLSHKKGPAVSNLSSTRALSDVCNSHNVQYHASAVGELNVVTMMKANNAVIGGEGNGGVILPELHYGRDALVGIAIMLNHLANTGKSLSALKSTYPQYQMVKNKIDLKADTNVDHLISILKDRFSNESINEIDGLKIDFAEGWVHLRKSNTEPIIRVYAEAESKEIAEQLIKSIYQTIEL